MTEQAAAAGSATAVMPNAGEPGSGNGAGGNGGSSAATQSGSTIEPLAGLDDPGDREWAEKNGLKDIRGIVQKARWAEGQIGSSVRLPGDDAKPEDWDKLYSRLGRPEKPDGYEFKPPADMPAELPYDQEFASWFKGAAHKAGLSAKSATAIHDEFVRMSVDQIKASVEKQVSTAMAEIEKAWGPKDSAGHKEQAELCGRGIQALGGDDLMADLKSVGLVGPSGEILAAGIAKAFAKAGKALGSESGFVSGAAAASGPNPFAEGATFNMTEQMKLIRNDPNRARSLITAAGKQPSDFGWTSS